MYSIMLILVVLLRQIQKLVQYGSTILINLLNYNFINETVSSKSKEFSINELIKERNHDKQLKDKIIAIDHYSQFSKEDKEVIEELFVKLVTARRV